MIEIDNDVAPYRKARTSKWEAFPFAQLNVGQSFHISLDEEMTALKLSSWAILASRKLGRRFSLRTVDESDPRGPGARVWRLEDKLSSLDSLFSEDEAQAAGQSPAPGDETLSNPDQDKPKKRTRKPKQEA